MPVLEDIIEQIPVLVTNTSPDLPLPKYMTDHASGMDIYAAVTEDTVLESLERKLIPTGLSIALPAGFEAQIRPRSGLALKHGLSVLNSPGTIDADYRGEIKIILFNHGNEKFLVNNGDRIAQMVLMPVLKFEFEETKDLPDTLRGSGGFGSTGKK